MNLKRELLTIKAVILEKKAKLNLAIKMDLNLIKKLIKNLVKNHHRNLTRNLKQTIKTWQI